MLRSGFPLQFIIKRNGSLHLHKLLPTVSHERYFITYDSDDGHQSKETLQEKSKLNETKSKDSSTSKIPPEEEINAKNAAAKKKLLSLISEIEIERAPLRQGAANFTLARAVKRPMKSERFKDILQKKEMTPEEKLQLAVKTVSESVSGDPEQTQLELNDKLQSLHMASKPLEENLEAEEIKPKIIDEEMKQNIMSSVEEIAATVTEPTLAAPKSELTRRLLRLDSKSSTQPRKSVDSLLKGMKVERETAASTVETKERWNKSEFLQNRAMQRAKGQTAINMFQAAPLDLFSMDEETKVDYKKTVWQKLEEKHLKLLVQFAPTNGFEEMILWTEQGKHWKFPIDNQTEMGEEENVGFNEHVFLEHHLHGFPTKGPIRVFMEHVVVGLSKNPYVTVDRKIENINWFRDYFKEKEEILREYGALG